MTEAPKTVAAFWDAARKAVPGLGEAYAVKRLGTSQDIAERLAALIVSGEKTGTFTLPWLHSRHPDWIPRAGQLVVYTDHNDVPQALIRQRAPIFMRYDQIGAAETACEGPGARDPNVWREIHWPYWTAQLKGYDLAPSPDMPVCVELFTLLYPKAS
ncbi:MAG: ASCH domain-containing protein [Rhodobacteraceae bacterium]|nr:ASCH domain-containing protein [Paracoccaceae bacterium]